MAHYEDRQLNVLEDIVEALKGIRMELQIARKAYIEVHLLGTPLDQGQLLERLPEGMTLEEKVQFRKDWDARVLDKHSLPKGD